MKNEEKQTENVVTDITKTIKKDLNKEEWKDIGRNKENPMAKLSIKEVKEIFILFYTKKYSINELAKIYKISYTSISRIINRKKWRFVTEEYIELYNDFQEQKIQLENEFLDRPIVSQKEFNKDHPKSKYLVGQHINNILIINFDKMDSNRRSSWIVKCNCGKIFSIKLSCLWSGTSSCGCLKINHAKVKHGKHKSRVYCVWIDMKQRCYNKNCNAYKNYGGRGIKICDKWLKFEGFYEDMGDRPPKRTLDRIDVNGDYCKENCRWATTAEQARNKRNNVNITHNNKTQCLADWAKEYNLPLSILKYRIDNSWPIEIALLPIGFKNEKVITYNGKTQNLKEWAEELNIDYNIFCHRIRMNWSISKIIKTPIRHIT